MTLPFTGAERPSKKTTNSHEHHEALEIRDTSHSVLKMGYSYSTNDTMAEGRGCNQNPYCYVWRRMMPDGQNLHWNKFRIDTDASNNAIWSKEYPNAGMCPTVLVQNVKVYDHSGSNTFGVANRCCCVRSKAGNFNDGSIVHRQDQQGLPTVDFVLTQQSAGNSNSFNIQANNLCLTAENEVYQDSWQNSIICL
jgi:hypothetical protein